MDRWKKLAAFAVVAGAGSVWWYMQPKPEVVGCEDFIKSGLQSPASFKRISLFESDEPISEEVYKGSATMRNRLSRDKALADLLPIPKTIHTLLVKYEASNSFGVMLPAAAICAFDGSELSKNSVDIAVTAAVNADRKRALISAGTASNDGNTPINPAFPCCLL